MPKEKKFFDWNVLKAHFHKIKHNLKILKTHYIFECFIFQKYGPNHKNQENNVLKN